jgi:hypothetical protein
MSLVVTLWPSRRHPLGRRDAMTWAQFVERFVAQPEVARSKTDVAGFALVSFSGRRCGANVERAYALTLDFDDGRTTLGQAARLFPGARGAVYTSFSSTPAHPKLRLILPLSRHVSAEEYALIWAWAEARCANSKRAIDASAKDPSRLWYVPSHPIGCATYSWRELPGRALDVERVLRGAARLRPLPSAGATAKVRSGQRRRQEVDEAAPPPTSLAIESFFGRAFALAGLDRTPLKNGAPHHLKNGALRVACPWEAEHTTGIDGDTSTVVLAPTSEAKWGIFKCSHAHCAHRTTLDLLEALPMAALNAAGIEHGRRLLRVRVHNTWVQHLDAKGPGFAAMDRIILRCRPREGDVFSMTVKIGSAMHVEGLDALPAPALVRRRIDVAMAGHEVTWARLVPEEMPKSKKRSTRS